MGTDFSLGLDLFLTIPALANAGMWCRCLGHPPIPWEAMKFCWDCKVWVCNNCAEKHQQEANCPYPASYDDMEAAATHLLQLSESDV